MANLRDVVKSYQEDLQEGIAWVAFWREGRSWNGTDFHLELDDNADEVLLPEQKKELEEILAKDPEAIILNGYLHGHLGISEEGEGTLANLYHGVRWHYQNGTSSKLKHFLEVTEVYNPQAELDEPASIDEQQKPAFDKDKFLNSEFGRDLRVKIKLWDEVLFDNQNCLLDKAGKKKCSDICSAYWEAAQAALYYFCGIRYHFSRGDDYCGIVSVDDGDWLFRIR